MGEQIWFVGNSTNLFIHIWYIFSCLKSKVLFILQPSEITEIVHSMNSTNICVDKIIKTDIIIISSEKNLLLPDNVNKNCLFAFQLWIALVT
jgi:hypothetical protein